MTLQNAVQGCIDAFCKVTQVAQVFTDERKLCFLRIYLFYPANLFNGILLVNIATDTINRVSRIDDDAAVQETFSYLPDKPWLGTFGMYMKKHHRNYSKNHASPGKQKLSATFATL